MKYLSLEQLLIIEYKIKMGVSSNIIDKYTVYSTETSNEMSKNISNYTNF